MSALCQTCQAFWNDEIVIRNAFQLDLFLFSVNVVYFLRASFRYRHHRLDSSEASFQSFRARRRTPSTWDCWRTTGPEKRLYRRRVRIDNVLSTARQKISKGAVGVDGKTDMQRSVKLEDALVDARVVPMMGDGFTVKTVHVLGDCFGDVTGVL